MKQCILNVGLSKGVVLDQMPQDSLLLIMTRKSTTNPNTFVVYTKQDGYFHSSRFCHNDTSNYYSKHSIMEKIKSQSIPYSPKDW